MPRSRGSTVPPSRAEDARTERAHSRLQQRDLGAVIASREAEQRRAHRFLTWLDSAMQARGIVEDARLAQMCGIAKSTITHWRGLENVPSFDVCKALARALSVPPLVVAFYAGHVEPEDLRVVARATGDALVISDALHHGTEAETEWGAAPLPASSALTSDDAMARAKLAIQLMPSLTEEAKWQIIGVLEALVAAAEMRERALRTHPDQPQYPQRGGQR